MAQDHAANRRCGSACRRDWQRHPRRSILPDTETSHTERIFCRSRRRARAHLTHSAFCERRILRRKFYDPTQACMTRPDLTMRWSERRTAVRSTFEITTSLPLRATRGLVRRRSSWSR